jgi:hypothetical protein
MRKQEFRFPVVWLAIFFVILAGVLSAPSPLPAQQGANPSVRSCNEFLVPKQTIRGKQIGQEDCKLIETDLTLAGRRFRRMDMGISGTLDGYLAKEGRYNFYFGSNPEFTYAQAGNRNPLFYGIGRYDAEKGSSVTFLYPLEANTWNGKMFVTAHGAGRSFKTGTLARWDKNLNPANPLSDISKYERLMLEKGYAVAKTRRSTLMQGGDTVVTLEDGTVLDDRNVTEQPRLIIGFARVGGNILERRLGRRPSRTYWYGHSGGARPGRIVNFQPGLNVGPDGKRIIDGLILDDSGSGLWLPIVMKNGKDILFTEEEEVPWFVKANPEMAKVDPKLYSGAKHKDWFVPEIEIVHLSYVNETPDAPPPWASTNFLANKRLNAKALRDKGLWTKHRSYEMAGISHSGGEYLPEGRRGDVVIWDMSRVMDGLVDMLDNWVEKGVAPPPTKSDWAELGDADRDGIIESGALRVPDVACPTGAFHPFPVSAGADGQGTTGFAPFTGEGLEPADGRGAVKTGEDNWFYNFVDMNRNGARDFRETMTQAWRRLELIRPNETFGRDKYAACIQQAVDKLLAEKFILPRTAQFYLDQAKTMTFPSR